MSPGFGVVVFIIVFFLVGLYGWSVIKSGIIGGRRLRAARLAERARSKFDGPDGLIEVITYELSGLSLNPTYITLDAKGELFAVASADFIIARKGYEMAADEPLRALSEKLESERFAAIQAEYAHRFDGPVRIRNVRIFDPATGNRSAASL